MSYTTPDRDRVALLTIDMQRDFTLPGAPASIPGTFECVSSIARLAEYFRQNDRPTVHLIRLYRSDGSNADLCRRKTIEEGVRMVEPGTQGARPMDEILPDGPFSLDSRNLLQGNGQRVGKKEWLLYKPRWGGFYGTDLEDRLQGWDVNTLMFTGCNFPNCPRTTVYEASERDFRLILVRDAVSRFYDRAARELEDIGVRVHSTQDCLNWLASRSD